jgi:hypothetical protein
MGFHLNGRLDPVFGVKLALGDHIWEPLGDDFDPFHHGGGILASIQVETYGLTGTSLGFK